MKHKSRAEKDRRYAVSAKGAARRRRYERSVKGRARTRRWRKSPKGRRAIHRYNVSPKGRAKRERSLAKVRVRQPSGREPVPEAHRRNPLHLTARDFTGPYRGDSGERRSRPGSADELLDRYNKLRNS